jgi:hypothetical protein
LPPAMSFPAILMICLYSATDNYIYGIQLPA